MVTVVAVSTAGAILAWIGLAVGLVVAGAVVYMLQGVLKPILEINRDVNAAHSAPLIERGVVGGDQLGRTRQLSEQVSNAALAFLGRSGAPAPGSVAARPGPAPSPFSKPGSFSAGSGQQSSGGWQIEDS